MTYLIDNNVLSELWRPKPEPLVVAWWNRLQADDGPDDWYVPVAVLAEIQEGAAADPSAKRQAQIVSRLDAFCATNGEFILPWDAETARTWGRLKHSAEVKRQPQALWDSLIDAAAVQHNFTVATRNGQDFRHAETFSPWSFKAKA